jgi:hypothetical protein
MLLYTSLFLELLVMSKGRAEVQLKQHVHRHTFTLVQLETICRALYHRKCELQKQHEANNVDSHLRMQLSDELTKIAEVWVDLLCLLHGKTCSRRKHVFGYECWRDDALIHFRAIKSEWIGETQT